MHIVHIGIGSNLGNRQENCLEAIRQLEQHGIEVIRRSSMIETEPWGVKDQPRFVNMAIEAATVLPPAQLLDLLKGIERGMGRTPTATWGPRIIDLDILFYDDLIIDAEDLTIPHPFLHEREFVLRPLAEIAPEKVHPLFGKTIEDLRQRLA
jgi:2-amino-4-hydroxy-6-hydroxymethyldihydropteridine diphosphokinase